MRERLPGLGYGEPTHCILSFFEYCCPCEPISLSILPMVLAWCCPCTYLYCYIPTMSHPPRFPRCGTRTHFLSLLSCSLLRTYVVYVSVPSMRWSLICCQDGCFMVRQRHFARKVSRSQLTSTAWRTLGLLGAFPTQVGGIHDPWAIRFLVGEFDLWEFVSPTIHASPPTLWTVLPTIRKRQVKVYDI